ncbi:MAG: flagellar export protein FliJ [Synergistaceae bacterium]|nr:flagellar export protein FliJ [Synergistota bacterium]NLM70842.1 flagellar export protein FliJ [Synergistaceae bacterium]
MKEKVDRFQRILKTREKSREEEQLLLADQRGEEERLVTRLDVLHTEKKKAFDEFRTQQGELVSPREMWFHRRSIDVVDKRICDGNSSLCDVRQAIEATEVRLVEKHREVRIMENYITSMLDDWRTSILKSEQSEMDDIAGIRHGNGTRGGSGS